MPTTILILGCITGIAALFAFLKAGGRWRLALGSVLILAVTGAARWRPTGAPDPAASVRVVEEVEGLYGHLQVIERGGMRVLLCNGIAQTAVPVSVVGPARGTLIRARDYVELIPYLRPQVQTALLIGVAGALHEQMLSLYGVRVHGVEIEPAAVRLAARHFALAAEVTVADGRAFLLQDRRRFDALILDTFLGGSVPPHLYTKEAFDDMAAHLTPDGILAVRLIARPRHPATRAVARTLHAVFPHVVAVRSGLANELQHIVLFASHSALELDSRQRLALAECGFTGQEFFTVDLRNTPLLTDDWPALGLLTRDLTAEYRRKSLKYWRWSL